MIIGELHMCRRTVARSVAAVCLMFMLMAPAMAESIIINGNHSIPTPTIQRWLAEIGDPPLPIIARQLADWYHEQGYYDATVVVEMDSLAAEKMILSIEEGPLVHLGAVFVRFQGDYFGALDQSAIAAMITGPASRQNIDDGLRKIVQGIAEEGYPAVRVSPVDFLRRGQMLSFTITIAPGSRARVGQWCITGLTRTDTAFVRRVLGLQTGMVWDRRECASLMQRIAGLDYLRLAAEPRIIRQDHDTLVTVELPLAEQPAVLADGGLGVDAEEGSKRGLRGRLRMTIENPFGGGQRLGLFISRPAGHSTESQVDFADPHLLGMGCGVTAGLAQLRQAGVYDRFSVYAGVTLHTRHEIRSALRFDWMRITPLSETNSINPARRYDLSANIGTRDSSGIRYFAWKAGATVSLRRTFTHTALTTGGDGAETISSADRVCVAGIAGRILSLYQGIEIRPLISAKSWLGADDNLAWGDEIYLGGPETVRGYSERAFISRGYVLLNLEAGLQPLRSVGMYAFIDLAYYRKFPSANPDQLRRRVFGHGFGLETFNYLGRTRLEFGWPERTTAGDGVIYLRWLHGW